MKNIHILPTDKPSRLANRDSNNKLEVSEKNTLFVNGFGFTPQNIYITSDEEIKRYGEYYLDIDAKEVKTSFENIGKYLSNEKKIILTTDQDLIDVQAIDDDFLEWFVKNPSCDEVECNNCGNLMSLTEDESIYVCYNSECTSCYEPYEEEEPKQSIIKTEEDAKIFIKALENIPEPNEKLKKAFKDFHKQETTLEEAAKKYDGKNAASGVKSFIAGAKWQQERSYSEEDMKLAFEAGHKKGFSGYPNTENWKELPFEEWFEQFKKK